MPEFKPGDLVWIAHNCNRDTECAKAYGRIFVVPHVVKGTGTCRKCLLEIQNEQFVIRKGAHIPSCFLRLIPPLSAREQHDERLLINLLEGLNARL